MTVLLTIVLALQMLSAIAMIVLILMQHGKGADAGAAFGGGGAGSASLFGASGSANFLSRSTGVLAAVFLVCTLALAYFGNLRQTAPGAGSVLEGSVLPAQTPAAQIPDSSAGTPPAPAAAPVAPPATGAAQIPSK